MSTVKAEIPESSFVHVLQKMLEASTPMVEMTPEEKSAFRMQTWSNEYGPAVARIGEYLIYYAGPRVSENPPAMGG